MLYDDSKNIILQNIFHNFEQQEILKNINYQFFKQKYLLIGPSGIGKTTLLNIISKNIIANHGKVISTATTNIIFQDFKLLEDFTIAENIQISLDIARLKNPYQHIAALLNIEHILHKYPNEISGGEQQRAAIARSLAIGGDIIIADEPTGNLDEQNTQNIINIFLMLHEKLKIGFIVSTHNTIWNSFPDIKLTIKNGSLMQC